MNENNSAEREIREAYEEFRGKIREIRARTGQSANCLLDGAGAAITPDKLKNTRFFMNRHAMLREIPKGGVCVEIGTLHGDWAAVMLKVLEPKKLHIVDINFNGFNEKNVASFMENGIVSLHKGDSKGVMETFDDDYFDVIYVDGDHGYEGVAADLQIAGYKIKSGGLILCNDFMNWMPGAMAPVGVLKAATEFISQHDCQLTHFAFQAHGYYDIGIQVFK